jgi:lysozyme
MALRTRDRLHARRCRWVLGAAAVLVVAAVAAALVWRGIVWPNRVWAASYDVRGVDVSHYQGEIDWNVLADQDIDFAWVKATEGSSHTDSRFAENWSGATGTDLLVGAYHFMSFESPGADQAANLAAHVPATRGTLPPVIDLEPYGRFFAEPPSPGVVREILDPLIEGIEEHYGVTPIVYATQDAYDRYLAGAYDDVPIWIRSVALPPRLPDGREWTLWQYSNRDRLEGYSGVEPYIDLNVFAGPLGELEAMTIP